MPSNLHDDESVIGQFLLLIRRVKILRRERILRPGVNVFDDRIFFLRIEIFRPPDDAVNVRDAVAALGHETAPASCQPVGQKFAGIGFFQLADQLAVTGAAAQFVDRRQIHARPGHKYWRSGENCASCVPSPAVRTVSPLPSKFTRQKWT